MLKGDDSLKVGDVRKVMSRVRNAGAKGVSRGAGEAMSGGTGIIGKKKGFVIKAQSAMNGGSTSRPSSTSSRAPHHLHDRHSAHQRDIKVVLPSTEKVEESKDVPVEQLVVRSPSTVTSS